MAGMIRLADVVDVLLVTALVYTAVVWLRRTRAAFAALGLLLLGALYALALVFDLRLTSWLLQSFFAILVVIIVVIFQEELRALFERLAIWSLQRSGRSDHPGSAPADMLVQAIADLARQHIGALVVLPGRQPIDRHVRGGIPLDGRLSVPLLESLFDPHSPGHDGAVVVEGDRIRRFAAHLPLSTDFGQLAGTGTRHAAALGLAEATDALCIVVSEERGTIALARDGRLVRPVDVSTLAGAIAEFTASLRPAGRRWPFWGALVREHGLEKVASLLVVSALWWALVPGARPVERTYDVPVRLLNVPETLEIDSVRPPAVRVTLEGPSREFYLFNPRHLELTLDVAMASEGRRTFRVDERRLRRPKGLMLRAVEPATIRITARRRPTSAPPPPTASTATTGR